MNTKVKWVYNEEREVNRVLYTCIGLANSFYDSINMNIVPYSGKRHKVNTVVVPEVPYNTVINFWKKIRKLSIIEIDVIATSIYFDEVRNMLKQKNLLTEPSYEKIYKEFDKEKENIFKILATIPFINGQIKEIEIFPTKFGTISSFSHLSEDKIVRLYIREDAKIADLLISIVASIVKPIIEKKYKATWWESQMVTYFIISESELSKYADLNNMLQLQGSRNNPKTSAELLTEIDFLENLGISKSHHLSVVNDNIFHENIKIASLTYSEVKALTELIENYPEPVSHSTMSKALCPGNLYSSKDAVYKAVERLRIKLKNAGVKSNILNVRNKGYLLY